ncbi:hypothetical protein ACHAQA_009409 [Verticillium albo-atrum]
MTTETILASKLFPSYYSSQRHLVFVATIFFMNYAFGIFFWLFLHPRFFSPLRHLPGPRAFLSDTHRGLIVKKGPSGDLFLRLAERYPGQDMIVLGAAGTEIFVTNPRLLADVLVHNCYDFAKPARISSFLRHILGDGLIIVEGNQHKFLRKNTMPAFHFRHIKDLYPMMWTKAEVLTKTLNQEIASTPIVGMKGSSVVDLTTWASKVTLDIIGVAGLGRNLNTLEKSDDPLHEIYSQLLEPTPEKLVYSMLGLGLGLSFVRLLPWKLNAMFAEATEALNSLCGQMIQEKRTAIQEKGDEHFDILSLLIKSNNFSDTALKDQLLTFLAAGHETTASALTWACYLLAKQPELQRKVRQEVLEGIPSELTGSATFDLAGVLEQLPYLNGTINESLRLYPTVPITLRQALRDTQIGDQFIPKGTDIVISIWYVNRSPEIWGPDAGEFRPERWITDDGKPNQNGGSSSNYDFLTFLHGPRSCIGQGFAKAEMRCLLAAMAMSFTWDLAMDDEKVVPKGVITIKPANGMYLKLTPLRKDTR